MNTQHILSSGALCYAWAVDADQEGLPVNGRAYRSLNHEWIRYVLVYGHDGVEFANKHMIPRRPTDLALHDARHVPSNAIASAVAVLDAGGNSPAKTLISQKW